MQNNQYRKLMERTEKYLYDFLNAYRTYHGQKERNGYVSFIVYIGFFATALLSGEWPLHHESSIPDYITILCVTIIWLYVLAFMKWQLRNRRIAAIYVAAAQELLARCLTDSIPIGKLMPKKKVKTEKNNDIKFEKSSLADYWVLYAIDYIWPININKYISVDIDPTKYPVCLSESINERHSEGTGAIIHERMLVLLGWLIYVGIILRIIWLKE